MEEDLTTYHSDSSKDSILRRGKDYTCELSNYLRRELDKFDCDKHYDNCMKDGTYNYGELDYALELIYVQYLLRNDLDNAVMFDGYRKSLESGPNTKIKIAYLISRVDLAKNIRSFLGYYS